MRRKILLLPILLLAIVILLCSCGKQSNGDNDTDENRDTVSTKEDIGSDNGENTEPNETELEKNDTEKVTERQTDKNKDTEKTKDTEKVTEKIKDTEKIKETESEKETQKETQKETESQKVTEKITEAVTEKETETSALPIVPPVTKSKWYLSDDGAFSVPSGIYTKEFEVELRGAGNGEKICYTLDNSVPTVRSARYSRPIKVGFSSYNSISETASTVIRFAIFGSNGEMKSKVYTSTYILVKDPDRFDMPIISLVTDDVNLYSAETGIFVTGNHNNTFLTGKAGEREVHFEYFDYKNGQLVIAQNGGMRLMGQGARAAFTHKTLRIFAKKIYDVDGKFKFDLYPDNYDIEGDLIKKFDSLILRSGSSNTYNSIINTQFIYRIAQPTKDLDTGLYSPAVVFLNGKYFGYMAVLEDYSTDFFALRYGIPEENVTTLNGGPQIGASGFWQLDDGPESEYDEFINAMKFVINHDMSNKRNYAQACTYFDMDNFIAYMAYEGYSDNWDWPRNNIRVWRCNIKGYDSKVSGVEDGRWRFLLKDIDAGVGWYNPWDTGLYSNPELDYFSVVLRDRGTTLISDMLASLLNNDEFKNRFINYTCDLLSTIFSVENMTEQLNLTEIEVSREVKHMLEWYLTDTASSKYLESVREWDAAVQKMRDFIAKRPETIYTSLSNYMGGVGTSKLTVHIEGGGTVKISTLEVTDGTELTYIKKVPIPFEVNSAKGYEVESVVLKGAVLSNDGTITLNRNATLTVKYKSSPQNSSGVKKNEYKYDPHLYGACLINGELYEKDEFKITNGEYFMKYSTAQKVFKGNTNAEKYLKANSGKDHISLSKLFNQIGANSYKIETIGAYVYNYSD